MALSGQPEPTVRRFRRSLELQFRLNLNFQGPSQVKFLLLDLELDFSDPGRRRRAAAGTRPAGGGAAQALVGPGRVLAESSVMQAASSLLVVPSRVQSYCAKAVTSPPAWQAVRLALAAVTSHGCPGSNPPIQKLLKFTRILNINLARLIRKGKKRSGQTASAAPSERSFGPKPRRSELSVPAIAGLGAAGAGAAAKGGRGAPSSH